MREWEKATWLIGTTEPEVIGHVGELIGRRARALTRSGDFILVLAGKGHNGDDARMAQPHLAEREVQVLQVLDPAAASRELEALLISYGTRPEFVKLKPLLPLPTWDQRFCSSPWT